MIRVEVNPEILRWALDRATEPESIRHKFPKLDQWLEAKSYPTLNQLEEFAKATLTPFGYFFLSNPPEEKLHIPLFRTLTDKVAPHPSPDLIETVRIMQRRQSWMREYLIEQDFDPLPFVGSMSLADKAEHVSEEMRRVLGLHSTWAQNQPSWTAALRELQRKAEDAGIIVVASSIVGNNPYRKLETEEFRGFVLVDEYAPLVFINTSDGKAAQMFTLAHELAHIWLGSSAAFDLRDLQPAKDSTEQACNRIAAEFLVPADRLMENWPDAQRRDKPLQVLARYFKVSEIVVARRALDLNLITKEAFFDFYNNYKKQERQLPKSHEGGNFYATQTLRLGRRFAKTVIRTVQEGSLLYHEAYKLTGLYGRAFDQFMEYLSKDLIK